MHSVVRAHSSTQVQGQDDHPCMLVGDDDCIITMSLISLQHTFSGSVGIFSQLAQIHLYQEWDSKSDNFAGAVYLNVVLLLKTKVTKCNDLLREQYLNTVINGGKHTLQQVMAYTSCLVHYWCQITLLAETLQLEIYSLGFTGVVSIMFSFPQPVTCINTLFLNTRVTSIGLSLTHGQQDRMTLANVQTSLSKWHQVN